MAGDSGIPGLSKQWFQKNKDWNLKSVERREPYLASKQWFQKNKDWNTMSTILLKSVERV